MNIAKPLEPAKGWLEVIKAKLSWSYLSEKLNISSDKLIEISSYLGVGFLFGFLLKRSFKYLVLIITVVSLLLWWLNSIGAIEWVKVREFCGVKQVDTFDTLFSSYLEWIKLNFSMVLSVFIGFLIGFKIG